MSPARIKLLLAAALLGLGAAGCGGGGNVYVGVGVVGPYGGYPYPVARHPGVYGRPGYWDEDMEEDASLDGAQRPRIERRAAAPPNTVTPPPAAADSTHRE
jgi:hypothetical protein